MLRHRLSGVAPSAPPIKPMEPTLRLGLDAVHHLLEVDSAKQAFQPQGEISDLTYKKTAGYNIH